MAEYDTGGAKSTRTQPGGLLTDGRGEGGGAETISSLLYSGRRSMYVAFDTNSASYYYRWCVIRSYRDRDSQAVAGRRRVSKFPEDIQRRDQRKLMVLNNATGLHDLRVPPGNRLDPLSGNRNGQYSIRINDQWRICFVWDKGDAFQVEIADYH